MLNEIIINGASYIYKEEFDVNLTLTYENENWEEWHIIREFISNALDSVNMDISKVEINTQEGFVHIHDMGTGYPMVYAKRIGASSKKNDSTSIGQFGEGSKLAMLACIRKEIQVMLCSQNWMIVPKSVESEGQQILMYDIFETDEPIPGSVVVIEATEGILEIINDLPSYFLHYNNCVCLFGSLKAGICPLPSSNKARLYNKGVYVKDIIALYSYAISLEKLNRDRDLISQSDMAYAIRDLWENVSDKELIKNLLTASMLPNEQKQQFIEFRSTLYSNHKDIWAEAFREMFGLTACLFSDEIASREASHLGFNVVKMDYCFNNILTSGGIKYDKHGLSDDYEFVFSSNLDNEEKTTLNKLPLYAQLAGFEIPSEIKVFDEYKNHDDIPGLYNPVNQQVYLRKDILKSNFPEALYTFLHELNHFETCSDDMSREFAEGLCRKLAEFTLKYIEEVGFTETLNITAKGIELPVSFSLSALNMIANIIVAKNELSILVAGRTIKVMLPIEVEKPAIWNYRKISISNGKFVVSLPEQLKEKIGESQILSCRIK